MRRWWSEEWGRWETRETWAWLGGFVPADPALYLLRRCVLKKVSGFKLKKVKCEV